MNPISYMNMDEFGMSKFSKKEVLSDGTQKEERRYQLLRAVLLHFVEHQTVKVRILKENDETFQIECAVICVTDEHLMLKSGLVVPIAAILSIELL
ncbi:hypothetical protein C943_02586 [Mariniradius saccharolyticus AK6]|uniref:Uncharacterized protein n=1 Tax=Mariniradius saccharolyticus AK6 TaxID=1239962 RepID=M7Y1Q6_9BACT|nr:hypothetical protein [Mariniradius saccharolyticus]EMS31146.1 hypothetical protein C943_02586 [Mariniradius saccharolyticus AK6]